MATHQFTDKTKVFMLVFLVILVIFFSWQGAVDDAARSYLNQSIKNAAITYGVTRLINAVVSVLQSLDISVVFVSVQIGDFLTPLHDTVERFAEVMTFAIVSLTLQRVLIEIVEHSFFNVLLTLSGVGLCLAVFIKMYVPQAVRLFVTLLFVRFSLALVLMLNMTVDYVFLEHQIQQEHEVMSEAKQELDSTYKMVMEQGEKAEESQTEKKNQKQPDDAPSLAENIQTKPLAQANLASDTYVEQVTAGDSMWGSVAGFVSSMVDDVSDVTGSIADTTVEVVDNAVDKVSSFVVNPKDIVLNKFKELKVRTMPWIENFLTLMALFLLKTIFLPLLFWYALLKGVKLIWVKDWSKFNVEQTSAT